MGRSVSTHRHAVATIYLHPELDEHEESFSDFLDDIRGNVLPEIFPSLTECDRWMDREDHVIAENSHCEVSVSEYCGLVAVCMAPRDPDNGFSVAWCERMADKFSRTVEKMFSSCSLRSIGRASNGEQFFQKV